MKAIARAPLTRCNLKLGCTAPVKEAAAAGSDIKQSIRCQNSHLLSRSSVSRRLFVGVTVANLVGTRSALCDELLNKEPVAPLVTEHPEEKASEEDGEESTGMGKDDNEVPWDWIWPGLIGGAGAFGLVAARPILSSIVKRVEKGPTRDFLLESRVSRALNRKFEAPPVQSAGVEIPLLDRKDKGRVLETCRWSQGAVILRGPSDSGKTTLVLQALDGRTNVIVIQLRQYGNKLVDGFKEALGLGRSEETTLLEVVQILRKSWNPKKRSGDKPVIFIDDAHLLGDTQLVLEKAARAELQLLLEIPWSGLGYLIMGTSEEAGAEVLLDQVSGGTRVGLLEYSFPNKEDVLVYFEKHLKLPKEVSAQIYTYVGGHLGEVGKVIARFQGSEPTAKDVSDYLARLEELATNKFKRALQGKVPDPTKIDATTKRWAYKILKQIKDSPQRRSALEISGLDPAAKEEELLEKLEAADKLVQVNVLRQNLDGTYSFHSPLYEYTFIKKSW